jgi:hypothetical protein
MVGLASNFKEALTKLSDRMHFLLLSYICKKKA